MADLITRHITWCKGSGKSHDTVNKRERLLRHMDARFPDGIERTCEDEIVEYFATYADVPWTLYTYDTHARAFFTWAHQRGLITDDPMRWIPKPAQGAKIPHPCTDEELAVALTAPAPYGRAMLLAHRAGLRCGEIARARREHITAGGRLRVLGKGNRVRLVPLDEATLATVCAEPDWLVGHGIPDRPVDDLGRHRAAWLTESQRRVWRRLGLPETFSLHSGRHWYATRLLESGALITEVRDLLGHTSTATTEIYLKVVDSRLAAAVDRLPKVMIGAAADSPDHRHAA